MNCKLCGTNNTHYLFHSQNTHGRYILNGKDSFIVFKCLNCGLVFLPEIVIDDAYYKEYYQSGYYSQVGIKKNNILNKILFYISLLSLKNKQRIMTKATGLKRKISILDIGCGEGNFLSQLDSKKFNKIGIEINRDGYVATKTKGIDVFNQDISAINFDGKKFDVISLWHVLEHINEPKLLFENIKKTLIITELLFFKYLTQEALDLNMERKIGFIWIPRDI